MSSVGDDGAGCPERAIPGRVDQSGHFGQAFGYHSAMASARLGQLPPRHPNGLEGRRHGHREVISANSTDNTS